MSEEAVATADAVAAADLRAPDRPLWQDRAVPECFVDLPTAA